MVTTPAGRDEFEWAVKRLWLLCLLGLACGMLLVFAVTPDRLQTAGLLVNLYLFRQQDTLWLGLASLAIALILAMAGRRDLGISGLLERLSSLPRPVALLTLATLVLGGAGVPLAYHGYALSLDEFLARFQAETLLGGHLLAPLKAEWAEMAKALQPLYVRPDLEHGLWGPNYRPLASATIALFDLVDMGKYSNVVLAAGCVPLVAALARRLWPAEPGAPALAAFLLASSPQFLIMAMTPYAMTANLFVGLLWLCCFLSGGPGGHVGAALTGFFAVGLHHIHVHPFFVLPFMLSLLRDRRWGLVAFYVLWYAAVLAFWIYWRDLAVLAGAGGERLGADEGNFLVGRAMVSLSHHTSVDAIFWLANTFRFLAWQNLILVPLLVLGLRHWRRAPRPLRLLGWAIVLSLVPYLLFTPSPGHGWGYRYLHPLLGNVALLAVFGWLRLKASLGGAQLVRARRILAALAAFSVLLGLPLRAVQVERFLAPFAASSAYIASLPRDVILIDDADVWFGGDLVRNDPYLERGAKVLAVSKLNEGQIAGLCRRYRVALVDFEALKRFGVAMMPREPEARAAARRKLRAGLQSYGCLPS